MIEIAGKYGKTPAQVAVAWLLHKSYIHAPIVGVSRVEQLEQLVEATQLSLEAEDIDYLEALYQPLENLLSIGFS